MAEYIEWRIYRYNQDRMVNLATIDNMKDIPAGQQYSIDDGVVFSD
jgi:hypothetical protein